MTVSGVETRESWRVTAGAALRRLAAVTWAGGLLGLLVGGVGGRLAMMLLARLNPGFTGVTSDDGFSIGQLTPSTFNLLAVATLLGVVGGGVYFVVRWLMFGPRWWQVLSISVGPAVVVGSMLVHRDGVDFTLQPVWLAVALFAAIPGAYAALLTVLAERWLAPGDGSRRPRSGWPSARSCSGSRSCRRSVRCSSVCSSSRRCAAPAGEGRCSIIPDGPGWAAAPWRWSSPSPSSTSSGTRSH